MTRVSSGTSFSTIATKIARCRGVSSLVHGTVQRGKQIPPFGLERGIEAEPVRQPIPVLSASIGTLGFRQKCRPVLADTSKMWPTRNPFAGGRR